MKILLSDDLIVWPTIALVGLIWVVWARLLQQRFSHLRRNPPMREDFATGSAALRYFEPVEMPANNLRNLFEMPALFFALVPLVMITGRLSLLQVFLAWLFVLFRCLHSWDHVVTGKVQRRFRWYLVSSICLLVMWLDFALDILLR
ncbi:MAG: MAPEG family protein [Sphingosinicella sp.]|nr:MAPEG family protein [Sphingosinicella sp.]